MKLENQTQVVKIVIVEIQFEKEMKFGQLMKIGYAIQSNLCVGWKWLWHSPTGMDAYFNIQFYWNNFKDCIQSNRCIDITLCRFFNLQMLKFSFTENRCNLWFKNCEVFSSKEQSTLPNIGSFASSHFCFYSSIVDIVFHFHLTLIYIRWRSA